MITCLYYPGHDISIFCALLLSLFGGAGGRELYSLDLCLLVTRDRLSDQVRANNYGVGQYNNLLIGLFSLVTPIPETSPMVERSNAVSAMCQQLSQGLSLLSSTDDPFLVDNKVNVKLFSALCRHLGDIDQTLGFLFLTSFCFVSIF